MLEPRQTRGSTEVGIGCFSTKLCRCCGVGHLPRHDKEEDENDARCTSHAS